MESITRKMNCFPTGISCEVYFSADILSVRLFSAMSFSFRDKLIQSSSIAVLQQVPAVTLLSRRLQMYHIAAN